MSSIVSDEKIYEQASLRRRMVIVVLIVLFLLGAIVAYNMIKAHFIAEYRKHAAAPAQTVSAAGVKFTDWQPEVSAVGSMRAVRGVDVTT